MANRSQSITKYLFIAFLPTIPISCAANYEGSSPSAAIKPYTFNFTAPGYPNKRVSAYIFGGGILIGIIRSNNMTDSKGNLSVTASATDSNNCATGNTINYNATSLSMHFRLDADGSSSYVYPSACPSDAGFLNTASLGSTYNYPANYWPVTVYYLSSTSTVSYAFSGTGLGTVSRQTYCSVVDATIVNPSINTTSILGYSQGIVNFTSGSGSAITTFRIPGAASGTYKHTCWIDADGSGTYNTGDKIATVADSWTISTWTTVP